MKIISANIKSLAIHSVILCRPWLQKVPTHPRSRTSRCYVFFLPHPMRLGRVTIRKPELKNSTIHASDLSKPNSADTTSIIVLFAEGYLATAIYALYPS